MLIFTALTLILTFLINKSKFSQKEKYLGLIIAELIIVISIYFFGSGLIGAPANDQTPVILNLSTIGSISPFHCRGITIDSMDSLKGWKLEPRDGASGTFDLVDYYKYSKGIQIKYNLGSNTSYILSKRRGFSVFGEDINDVNEIGIYYTGNGSTNSIELDFTDQDGKRFGKTWRDVTGEEGNTYLGAKLSDFKCSTCNDENETIDLSKVVAYRVAISEKAGEEGGEGVVTIDCIVGSY